VLLYTDGVTEAHARGSEPFALAGWLTSLSGIGRGAHQPRNCCAGSSARWLDHQGGQLRDDATLLLLRWADRAAPGAALGRRPGRL